MERNIVNRNQCLLIIDIRCINNEGASELLTLVAKEDEWLCRALGAVDIRRVGAFTKSPIGDRQHSRSKKLFIWCLYFVTDRIQLFIFNIIGMKIYIQ